MSEPIYRIPPYTIEREDDFRASGIPWHLADQNMPTHWEQTGGGEGIIVGVGDTGIDSRHKELGDRLIAAKSFVGGNSTDRNRHGTHVATTIMGQTVGLAPKAQLVVAKVLSDGGSGGSKGIAGGIDYMVEQGCHIINLSLGSKSDSSTIRAAVLRAIDAGVLVFAATGNDRASRVGYPAYHCVGVGAVDRNFKLAQFSNRGERCDVVGYGVGIYAGTPGNKYASMSGTSMSTPYISGLAANRLSAELKHGGKIVTDSHDALDSLSPMVIDLGPDGRDPSYGRGFPDVTQAFYDRLTGDDPVPEPVPPTPDPPTPPVPPIPPIGGIDWEQILDLIMWLISECEDQQKAYEALRHRPLFCLLLLSKELRAKGYERQRRKFICGRSSNELGQMSDGQVATLVEEAFARCESV